MQAEKVSIGVNTAQSGAAQVTFEWAGKPYSKAIAPNAWKKVWEHFGGSTVSNQEIKGRAEQWLCSALRATDRGGDVLDLCWVNDNLPSSNAA